MAQRPSWEEYFMEIARTVGARGTCDRGRAGAVIVKEKRILTTGYAGSGPGMPHCDDEGHFMREVFHADGHSTKHCVRTIHAEMNAIVQAARFGVNISGGTVYCKMEPCLDCCKAIIGAGIKRVVAEYRYHAAEDTREFFKQAKIVLDVINDEQVEYAKKEEAEAK